MSPDHISCDKNVKGDFNMFKQNNIISREEIEKLNEDICDVCYLHEQAKTFFQEKCVQKSDKQIYDLCPICNERLQIYNENYDVIGGHNEYTEEEIISYNQIKVCSNCNKYFAMMPIEIIYNGNHDIFYTGGNCFFNKTEKELLMKKIKDSLTKSTEQFVKRIRTGDKSLNEWNLEYWNENEIEHAIAEFLYKKGLKK